MDDDIKKLLEELEGLVQEPGFIYSLALIAVRDLFFMPDEFADINWHEHLSFQELSLVVGMMIKLDIDCATVPDRDTVEKRGKRLYELCGEIHMKLSSQAMNQIFKEDPKEYEGITEEEFERKRKEVFQRAETMVEPIFYSGSGAYDFQYLEYAKIKYSKDEVWIRENEYVSISVAAEIAKHLKKLSIKKLHNLRENQTESELQKSALDIFCFTKDDLSSFKSEDVERFLNSFSVKPGAANSGFNQIGAYNEFDSHPVVLLDDGRYFLPIDFLLAQSIYESPYYWMGSDKSYVSTASQHRGDVAEEIAGGLLSPVFGSANVYKNVIIKKGKDVVTDIDVLAIQGNKALVVQVKSKRITEESKKGDAAKVLEDFKKAVQDAYDQGLKSRAAIIEKNTTLYDDTGTEIVLDERINDAYIVCLTTDHYPSVTHQADVYLEKDATDPFPLAMSIFDLDVIAYYLRDPYEFLYYARQRTRFSGHFKASSEMALIGKHLREKLFPREGVDGEMVDESFAQLIDGNFSALRGDHPMTKAAEKLHHKWRNEEFQKLIDRVKETRDPGFTDALFMLYDLAGDGADNLMKVLRRTKDLIHRDKQPHTFALTGKEGESGISFVGLVGDGESLGRQLLPYSIGRKYKSKANEWLGLGWLEGSPHIVDAVTYNGEPWEESEELEQIAQTFVKKGIAVTVDGKKIGRNDPCACGSGKKYKKCCLK